MSSSLLARRLFSSSVTAARRASGSHLLRLDGYSLLEQATRTGSEIASRPFAVGGRKWELLLYPNGIDADHRRFVSADLRLADSSTSAAATATYRVSILDHAGDPAHSRAVGPRHFTGPNYIDRSRRYRYSSSSSLWSSSSSSTTPEDDELTKKTSVDELVAAEELRRAAPFLLRDDRLSVRCDVSVVEVEMEKERKPRNRWFMGLDRVLHGSSDD